MYIVLIIMLAYTIAYADNFPKSSAWQNQSGSQLFIENIDSYGNITGYYVNHASGFPCKDTPYPLTGWMLDNSNIITFSVKWQNAMQNCMALTSWIGYVGEDGKTITTHWQLVKDGCSELDNILMGDDIFTYIEPSKIDK